MNTKNENKKKKNWANSFHVISISLEPVQVVVPHFLIDFGRAGFQTLAFYIDT